MRNEERSGLGKIDGGLSLRRFLKEGGGGGGGGKKRSERATRKDMKEETER